MEIVRYVAAMMFALGALTVLVIVMSRDVRRTREYFKADKVMARVEGHVGERHTANYGKYQRATKYQCYAVSFVVAGVLCSGEFLSKKKTLQVGDYVEVRFKINEKHEAEIVNRDIADRFFRFLLSAAIAIPLSILYIMWLG